MTAAQLALLQTPEAQALVAANVGAAPAQLALRLRDMHPALAALVATQVRLLQGHADRLPQWVAARCLLHPEAAQQASSSAAAKLKFQNMQGQLAIDLTAGMGVDAVQLAAQYRQVIAVEQDPVRAALLRHNLALLAVHNVQVVQADGLAWLAAYTGPKPDLLYIDPARRTDTHTKAVALQHCLPDLSGRSSQLVQRAAQVCIKLSPLYEVVQAARDFTHLAAITVISIDNECKEVLCRLTSDSKETVTEAIMQTKPGVFSLTKPKEIAQIPTACQGFYLIEPDVAVYKGHLWQAFFAKYLADVHASQTGLNGYFLTEKQPRALPGRVFSIVSILPFTSLKAVVAYLKQHAIAKANLSKKVYKTSVVQLRQRLGLLDGGADYLFFTETPTGAMMLHARY